MPDITLPHTFVDGAVAASAEFAGNTYSAKATPDSLYGALNGRIDDANLKAGETVDWRAVRSNRTRGAFTASSSAASTLNIDLPLSTMVQGYDLSGYIDGADRTDGGSGGGTLTRAQLTSLMAEFARPVVAVAYYLPYACTQVSLSWQMSLVVSDAHIYTWNDDSTTNHLTGDGLGDFGLHQFDNKAYLGEIYARTGIISGWPPAGGFTSLYTPGVTVLLPQYTPTAAAGTRAQLFVDDSQVTGMIRNFGDGLHSVPDIGPTNSGESRAVQSEDIYEFKANQCLATHDVRYWNGNLTIDANVDSGALTAGWHTASIRVIHDRRVVRVKCRRMQALGIR